MKKYILAIDQGTSGTLASLYNRDGHREASVDVVVKSIYPHPGWVEQDPFELLESIKTAAMELIDREGLKPGQIESLGVANQGECLLLWDTETGKPIHNMIGWQCVRSADLCSRMTQDGLDREFKQKTGLPLDPEWPATKFPWAKENLPEVPKLLNTGRLAFSQSDSWFMFNLTKEKLFLTDHSTASRSGFYNLETQNWDDKLIALFQGENLVFPKILDSADYFGDVDFGQGWVIPWRGNALDQSSALLGQACIDQGEAKVTYGTCAAFWYNLGQSLARTNKMDTSVAWQIDGRPTFAAVGEAITAGASMIWLRDKLNIEWDDSELSDIAYSAQGQDDLIFVSALSGLGAPYWEPKSRGVIYGITAGTGQDHLVRAGLDSVAYSVRDLLEAFSQYEGHPLPDVIKVDGGMTSNDYLMQFQADILGKPVLVPKNREGTSTGVAALAGVASGYYEDISFLQDNWDVQCLYEPKISSDERETRYKNWKKVVGHTLEMYSP